EAAVEKAERLLKTIKEGLNPALKEHAHLLEVHQMILRDRLIFDETLKTIREEKYNALWALTRSLMKAHELFRSIDDEYIRSRVADVDGAGNL
ncbi:phosphoenolpyruvate-utilizing N-terminal domain-containing protein, partial [Klebsiella pneumoniae]|uniref:phosphoenolpyruvate-utilizing N-terminal domain-containing protein n=1 Tax=Klebsiella pneumoniae TaxID=573 RepID=UPI00272FDE4B